MSNLAEDINDCFFGIVPISQTIPKENQETSLAPTGRSILAFLSERREDGGNTETRKSLSHSLQKVIIITMEIGV